MIRVPNPNYTQGQATRRNGGKVTGTTVIHSFENVPDTELPDDSAESGLAFLRRRTTPGCYHGLSDADSRLALYPYDWETWHCRNTNNWSVGFCMAGRASMWSVIPEAHAEAIMHNCATQVAEFINWLKIERGIYVPIRWITTAEAMARKPGLITHGRNETVQGTDPTRRTDPGFSAARATRFLTMVGDLTGTGALPPSIVPAPSPGSIVPPFPGTVRLGSRGNAVWQVQRRFIQRGGWNIIADGWCGPKTDAVIRAYQRMVGLVVDGVVGPITWRSLWTEPIR